MNKAQLKTWHYVLDIHDSTNGWYSIDSTKKEISIFLNLIKGL